MDPIQIIILGTVLGISAGLGFYLFIMRLQKKKLIETVEAKLENLIKYFRGQPKIRFQSTGILMYVVPYTFVIGFQYIMQLFTWILGNPTFATILWLIIVVGSFLTLAVSKHELLLRLIAGFAGTKNVACQMKTPEKTESVFLTRLMPPIECDWPDNYLESIKNYVEKEKHVDIADDLKDIEEGKVHLYYTQTKDELIRMLLICKNKTFDELYEEDGDIEIDIPSGDTITIARAAMRWKFLKYEPVMSTEKIFEKLDMDNMMLPMFMIGGDGVTSQEIEAGFSNYDYRVGAFARQRKAQLESENTKLKIQLKRKGLDEDTMSSISTVRKIEETQKVPSKPKIPVRLRKYLPYMAIAALLGIAILFALT